MVGAFRQLKSAARMLDRDEVKRRAERPLAVGLAAADDAAYAAMEDFLLAGTSSLAGVYRAGDPARPDEFDLILAQPGIEIPGSVPFDPVEPDAAARIVWENDHDYDLSLPLARRFPSFRQPMVDRIVHSIAKENAMFSLVSALPNVVPSFLLLPWAVGEFASDTAFLTMNQVRMAFLVAGACGREVGLAEQKAEVLSIAAGALGWRAIARELAGKIPMGGGLIPKAAVAYAGTFVIGKGLAHFNDAGRKPSRAERKQMYRDAYQRGREVAEGLRREIA